MNAIDLISEKKTDIKNLNRLVGVFSPLADRDVRIRRTKHYYSQKWNRLQVQAETRIQKWICNKMIEYVKEW